MPKSKSLLTQDFSRNLKTSVSAQKKLRRARVVFESRHEKASYFRASKGLLGTRVEEEIAAEFSLNKVFMQILNRLKLTGTYMYQLM